MLPADIGFIIMCTAATLYNLVAWVPKLEQPEHLKVGMNTISGGPHKKIL